MLLSLGVLLLLSFICSADPLPVVLLHGLGGHSQSNKLNFLTEEIKKAYPGIFVYSARFRRSEAEESASSYFGKIETRVRLFFKWQIKQLYRQFSEIPELRNGFNAVGISQGGQMLRAYVEKYNNPPVHTLITLGSQHQGVHGIPKVCKRKKSFDICALSQLITSGTIYTDLIQSTIIPAQYYKNLNFAGQYFAKNKFLTDINNEIEPRNEQYSLNMQSLKNFVMVKYSGEEVVVPAESSWFYVHDGARLVPLREQQQYLEDWIGLKTLDKHGRLHLEEVEGAHAVMNMEVVNLVIPFLIQ